MLVGKLKVHIDDCGRLTVCEKFSDVIKCNSVKDGYRVNRQDALLEDFKERVTFRWARCFRGYYIAEFHARVSSDPHFPEAYVLIDSIRPITMRDRVRNVISMIWKKVSK